MRSSVAAAFMLMGLAMAACHAYAAEADTSSKPIVHIKVRPQDLQIESWGDKRWSIAVKDNPSLTAVIRQSLSARGIQVADNSEDTEVKVSILGRFSFAKPLAPETGGMLRELPANTAQLSQDETLRIQGIQGRQIALGALVTRTVSITEVLTYLGQQSGIAGWFNKALTGDPRGVCLTTNCDQIKTQVILYTTLETGSKTISWTTIAVAMDKKMVLDQVVGEAFDAALQPLIAATEENRSESRQSPIR